MTHAPNKSAPVLTGVQWLQQHDPREQPHSPRFQRFRQRRREAAKAKRQRRMQDRAQPMLLRSV